MNRTVLGFVILVFGISCFSPTKSAELRKYAGEFMSIDVSARAQAMGGAFSSLSDDVYATFYNPAGLVQVRSTQVGFTHTQQFLSSVNYDYIGFSHPISNNKTIGFSLVRLGVDNIQDSRQAGILDGNGLLQGIDESQIDKFNSSDYVFFFSLGHRLSENWMMGFNAKLVRRNLAEHSANGLGFDAGIMYAVNYRWKFAALFRNITTTLIAWDTGEKELVSPTMRLGSSYLIPLPALSSHFVPIFDLVVFTQSAPHLTSNSLGSDYLSGAVGGEFVIKERLSLRGGYDELQRLNFGIGIRIPHIMVDYSFTNYDQELGNAHRIGLLVDFNQ
jgi:hypothetical protein